PPGGPPALLAAPAPPELEISEDDAVFREKVVAHILSKDLEIPLLPHVAMNVIKLTNDARSSMQDLARVVLTDQGIASRILKIANSPVYAGAVEVKTISQALVRLGQREVKNLMLAISLQGRVFKSASYQSLARKLWEHSIAVAFSSRVVANALRLPKEEAFLAGLMHDMGKMVLLNLIERCLREMPVKYRPSMPLVLDTLRQFNADVGEMVVARWDLPDEIRRAVRRGEPRPDGTPTDADAVAIGNAIAEIKAIGPDTWDGPLYEHPAAMNLHLSREACEELIRRFDQMYEPARGLFG
ncbi:HDOD domain-containing protein, partial [bacterium]|nr:HDOD domain-containing protein [bacterium]